MTSLGCFSSAGDLTVAANSDNTGAYGQMSYAVCIDNCKTANMPVMGLTVKGTTQYCYCGSLLPPKDTIISDSSCDTPCNSYPANDCGGDGAWNVLLSGVSSNNPGYLSSGASGGSDTGGTGSSGDGHPKSPLGSSLPISTSLTVTPTFVTIGNTIVKTIAGVPTSSQTSGSSSSGSSKAGVAAGVVVGLVVLAAIIAGVVFFLRHRRRKELESEHRRHSSVTAFTANKHPHMSTLPANDSRLDPIVAARRQSDGSIADNQDFSRRVLKVTNPDDRW